MNLVISGQVESGKTTWCLSYAKRLTRAGFRTGGIICLAVMANGKKIGCDAEDQQILTRRVFARLSDRADFTGEAVGRYLISPDGLTFARQALNEAITKRCDLILIDEIGPFDLAGRGLMDLAEQAYRAAPVTITVVRRKLLEPFFDQVQKHMSLEGFYVIDTDSGAVYNVNTEWEGLLQCWKN